MDDKKAKYQSIDDMQIFKIANEVAQRNNERW